MGSKKDYVIIEWSPLVIRCNLLVYPPSRLVILCNLLVTSAPIPKWIT